MPDTADNSSTTIAMGTNAVLNGRLEVVGDRDWIRVSVQSGTFLQVDLAGTGADAVFDPYLSVYERNNNLVAFNDDSGSGLGPPLQFQSTYTGDYFISAASYNDRYDGDYQIRTQAVAAPNVLDSIIWGTQISGSTIDVYFAPSGQTFDGYTSEGFNAYECAQILEILDYISTLADLDFNIVTNVNQAELILVLDLNEISNERDPFLGYFNPPGTANAGVGVFNGDLWDRRAGGDLERGGFGYVTLNHELLHGLGLAHPHDPGGSSTVMNGVTSPFEDYGDFNLNQGIFTTMTYNSGYFTGSNGSAPPNPAGGTYGFEGGNNVYTLSNANTNGTYWEAIWDTGGTDQIVYNGARHATIDLRPATLAYEVGGGGFVSAPNGVRGGFTIANGVVIENARGGSGADLMRGNSANNVLRGENGADRIFADTGNDRLIGGGGADRLFGQNDNDFIYGGSADDVLAGGNGNDRLFGNDSDDRLFGGAGKDRLFGQEGDDRLVGGTGSDRIAGGAGQDIITGQGRAAVTASCL